MKIFLGIIAWIGFLFSKIFYICIIAMSITVMGIAITNKFGP